MGSLTYYGSPVAKAIDTARFLLDEAFPAVRWSVSLVGGDWILKARFNHLEWVDIRFHTEDRSGEVEAEYFYYRAGELIPTAKGREQLASRGLTDGKSTAIPISVMNFGTEVPTLYPEAIFTAVVRALKTFPLTKEKL